MATTYREGSENRDMNRRIQKIVGCYADGIWGPRTTEAVKVWQKSHGLTPDGIVGPATLAMMGLSAAVQAVTPASSGISGIQHGSVFLKRSRRRIDQIVIHCTATPEGQDKTVQQIRKEHIAQGWSDIGYHYVVYRDGTVHLGRDVDVSGSHVSGHNSYTIGVVYVGGLENKPLSYNNLKAKDTRTAAQKDALLSLLVDLRRIYPKAVILGHRDFSPDKNGNGEVDPWERIKECPSFDARKEYSRI